MKKEIVVSLVVVCFLLNINLIFAATTECNPSVQLLSQDPYPAVPGDYVKLVFQIDGISDPSCGEVNFKLINKYPLVFDPGQNSSISLRSGTYIRDYPSHKLAAFKVRVDQDAVNGDNPLEVEYSIGSSLTQRSISEVFNLNVEDTRADFEIYVKNLDFNTDTLSLEVLNIAEVDVKSIAVEILDYPHSTVKGAKTKIIGDLDSNEYTSAEFEIKPQDTSIPVKIFYTDNAGFRRSVEKNITLDTSLFQNRKADEKSTPVTSYIILLVIVIGIWYWLYKRKKVKDSKKR